MSEKRFVTERLKMWRNVEHADSFERTLSNIEQYGWDVMVIKGDPQTRFSYTVGVHDTLGFPELIVVGLTNDTGAAALNAAVDALQKRVDLTAGRHRDIVGEVEVEFRTVAEPWIEHVMYRDYWYYQGERIPALQLIYPDLEGRFQWEDGFEDYFRQPLMQTAPPIDNRAKDFWAHNDPSSSLFDWKFPDPPHTQGFLSQAVQDRAEAITYVAHEASDGAWQFLGDSMADGGGPVVSCIHHPLDWDPSVRELHDLPRGWYAVRDKPGDPWQRFEIGPEHDG
ncbi:MAG TPA: DUF4262 domain-containing protein [Bryocella sp.]|nr:DUF4262 domain-containing protein [Bryocella sp.]